MQAYKPCIDQNAYEHGMCGSKCAWKYQWHEVANKLLKYIFIEKVCLIPEPSWA